MVCRSEGAGAKRPLGVAPRSSRQRQCQARSKLGSRPGGLAPGHSSGELSCSSCPCCPIGRLGPEVGVEGWG